MNGDQVGWIGLQEAGVDGVVEIQQVFIERRSLETK